jgi:hypothetical protein
VEEENRQLSVCVLARWLGVTDKTVRELVKADIAVRAERGLYRLEESVRRYSEHIRQTASQWGGEASLEAIRDALGLKRGGAGRTTRGGGGRGGVVQRAAHRAGWYTGSAEPGGCAAAAPDAGCSAGGGRRRGRAGGEHK